MRKKYYISIEKSFSAAHALRGYKGKCEKIHGHTWKVSVEVVGKKINHLGMLIDFSELKLHLEKIISYLDHTYINDIEPFISINPTAENIATYIFDKMKKSLSLIDNNVSVKSVTVWESETSKATIEV